MRHVLQRLISSEVTSLYVAYHQMDSTALSLGVAVGRYRIFTPSYSKYFFTSVLVLACIVRYEETLFHLRRASLRCLVNVGPSNLSYCRISLIPSPTGAPNTTVLSLLPCRLTVTGSQTRDHSFRSSPF